MGGNSHTLGYVDSYGDGWHGGYIEVLAADGSSVVDPIDVVGNGGELDFVLQAETVAMPACTGDDWDVHLADDYGDGWNGATLSVEDCCGNLLQGGVSLGSGSVGSADVCVPLTNDGFTITAGGGSWDEEISWSLIDPNGIVEIAGAGGTVTTCETGCDTTLPCSEWDLHIVSSGNGWEGATLAVSLVLPASLHRSSHSYLCLRIRRSTHATALPSKAV